MKTQNVNTIWVVEGLNYYGWFIDGNFHLTRQEARNYIKNRRSVLLVDQFSKRRIVKFSRIAIA